MRSAIISGVTLSLRPARTTDAAGPELLYVSAQPYYDAFAGSPERARRVLEGLWDKDGHTAAFEHCTMAELDGAPAGAMVAFPAEDGDALARRFLALAFPRLAIWRWPAVMRHLHASAQVMPIPPARTLYVDALAVVPARRRRGVATALLAHAEEEALRCGLRGVALDTGLGNAPAQALYEGHGFLREGEKRAPSRAIERAIGGPGFVSYFKPV